MKSIICSPFALRSVLILLSSILFALDCLADPEPPTQAVFGTKGAQVGTMLCGQQPQVQLQASQIFGPFCPTDAQKFEGRVLSELEAPLHRAAATCLDLGGKLRPAPVVETEQLTLPGSDGIYVLVTALFPRCVGLPSCEAYNLWFDFIKDEGLADPQRYLDEALDLPSKILTSSPTGCDEGRSS